MPGERIQFDLIAGLGNPGAEHANDRHNAGFWFIDALARQLSTSLTLDKKHRAETATARLDGRSVQLVKPVNYMNNSGEGVGAVSRFYKIEPQKILVVHDELDLPPGHLRLKRGGGHGGHNGLRDIIARLGSSDFWRLRVGIGHPGHKSAVVDYVLKRASAEHQRLIDEAIELALREAREIIDGDIARATQTLHRHKPESN